VSEELESAHWFTVEEVAAACDRERDGNDDGEGLLLSASISISRWLIDQWLIEQGAAAPPA
jgi:NAD+ diphosphatase